MIFPTLDPQASDLDQVLEEALRSVGMDGTELALIFELGFRMGAQVAGDAARAPRAWRRLPEQEKAPHP